MASKKDKNTQNPKISDISAIFNQLNNSTKSVNDLLVGLDNIASTSSKFGLRKRSAIKSANSLIQSYMTMVSSIIEQISSATDSKSDKTLAEILGYQETMKEVIEKSSSGKDSELSEKITTDGKYPIIDFMAGFATMMGNLVDPLQKIASSPIFLIAGSRFGGFIKDGFSAYADMMKELLNTILNSFSNIDTSKLGDVVTLLVGDPETITKLSNKKESSTESNGSKQSDVKDFAKEVTTGKKMGVLELISGLLGIMDTISKQMSINPAKRIIMRTKISIFASYIKEILDGVLKALPSDGADNKKYESLNKTMDNISSIISSLSMLELPDITELIKSSFKANLFEMFVNENLFQLFDSIDFLLTDVNISSLGQENSEQSKTLNILSELLGGIVGLTKLVATIPLTDIIAAQFVIWRLSILFSPDGSIKKFIEGLSALNVDETVVQTILNTGKNLVEILDSIKNTVKTLSLIGLYIILGAAALVVSIFAMPLFIFGVIALVLFIFTINKILGFITRVSPQIAINIVALVTLIGGISLCFAIISLTFIVIALSFSIIIKHIWVLMLGLGILMLFLVLFTAFSAFIGAASPIILAGAITTAIVVGAMTITLIGLMTIALLLIALTYIADWMDPDNILAATDTVLGTALKVLEKLLTADFGMRDKAAANTGLLGGLARFLLGGQAATVIDLIEKIAIIGLTIIAVASLMLLGFMMASLVEFVDESLPSSEKIKTAVDTILKVAFNVINSILNNDFGSGLSGDKANPGRGAIGWIANTLGGSQLLSIVDLILKSAVVIMTFISVGLIYALVSMIIEINKFITDEENAAALENAPENIKSIIEDCYDIINTIVSANPPKGKSYENRGLLSSIIGLVNPNLANVVDLIFSIFSIATTMVVLGAVLLLAKEVKSILNKIDKMDIANAKDKIATFMTSVNDIVSEIINADISFGKEGEAWYSKVAKAVLPTNLISLAQIITKMGQIGLAQILFGSIEKLVKSAHHANLILNKYGVKSTGMQEKMKNLLNSVKDAAKGVDGLNDDDNLTEIVNKVSKYQLVVKETDKLVNKVNGLNLAKMKAFAEMWMHAASFSKSINGNFDKLADALTNKIAPLLDGLKNAIESADKHIQESAKKAEEAKQAAKKAAELAQTTNPSATPLQTQPAQPIVPGSKPTPKPTPKPIQKKQSIDEFFKENGYLPIKSK